ncbi:DUF2156 domain-containing protein [Microbacterium sp. 1P10UB]|uniref:bifunctional lysylphosphatidylglycerol flippase/synthetase MprF n=1 Tax=unclassified Microbacterium TaxID=2609290 RepID=UPI0039A14FA9
MSVNLKTPASAQSDTQPGYKPWPVRLRTWVRRHPATIALTAVIAVLTAASSVIPQLGITPHILGESVATEGDQWLSTLLSLFAVADPLLLFAVIPLAVVVLGFAEHTMGSFRTLLSYSGGGVLSTAAGLGIGYLEEQFLDFLPLNAPTVSTVTPVVALICTAMAASSFASALWRRRVRLFVATGAITAFLYSGSSNDLFSLTAVPVGMVVGLLLGGRRRAFRLVRSTHHEKRVLLAAVTLVTAIGPVLATMIGSGAGLLSVYGFLSHDPVVMADGRVCAFGSLGAACPRAFRVIEQLHPAAGVVAVLPALMGALAAWGIFRGRRAALWMAVALNGVFSVGMAFLFIVVQPETVAAVALIQDVEAQEYVWQTLVGSVVAAVVPLVTAVILVVFCREAPARSTKAARRRFTLTLGVGVGGALLIGGAGALVDPYGFMPSTSVGEILGNLPLRLLPPTLLPSDGLNFVPVSGWAQASWYLPSLWLWVCASVGTALFVLAPGAVDGAVDRGRARSLLQRGGGDSLSFMATWPGNTYWFAPDRDAGFAFRVRGSIAVTLGGAFGPDASEPAVVTEFVEFCGAHGWTPVFYSVTDPEAPAFAQLGWQRLPVAEEATLVPAEWSLSGKRRQDIRTATNRAARENLTARWTSWPELAFAEHAQIRDISEAWVAEKSLPEMEFTLGGADELTDPDVRIMLAIDVQGRIQAVTSWLPLYGQDGVVDGYTLDFMRRRSDAMNGVMEFVIGSVATRMKEQGLKRMSLSGSPLASVPHDHGDSAVLERLLARLGELIEPGYGFRSLLSFKRKFQPRFDPLWLLYPDAAILPAAAVAIARSYLPNLTLTAAVRMVGTLRKPPTST